MMRLHKWTDVTNVCVNWSTLYSSRLQTNSMEMTIAKQYGNNKLVDAIRDC